MTEYVAAVCRMRNGAPEPFNSIAFVAHDAAEARQVAKNWVRSLDFVSDDALLQVNADGRGVFTLGAEF